MQAGREGGGFGSTSGVRKTYARPEAGGMAEGTGHCHTWGGISYKLLQASPLSVTVLGRQKSVTVSGMSP